MILGDNETVLAYCPPACANGRVRLPETITRIEDYAFEDCKQLTAVDFPDGPLEIGRGAFKGCPLKSVTRPQYKKCAVVRFPGMPGDHHIRQHRCKRRRLL